MLTRLVSKIIILKIVFFIASQFSIELLSDDTKQW